MKNLTISKYIRFILILLGFFIFMLIIGILVGGLRDEPKPLLGLGMGAILGVVVLLFPMIYYIVNLVKTNNGIKLSENKVGFIKNWKVGFIRGFGKVSVVVDGTQYFTDTLFTSNEAHELVGKEVNYCIVDEKLVILSVLKIQ